jgi:hypothetical protein
MSAASVLTAREWARKGTGNMRSGPTKAIGTLTRAVERGSVKRGVRSWSETHLEYGARSAQVFTLGCRHDRRRLETMSGLFLTRIGRQRFWLNGSIRTGVLRYAPAS